MNIRKTLEAAHRAQIISDATREILAAAGAALFYRDAEPGRPCSKSGKAVGADPAELTALQPVAAGRPGRPAGR